MQLKKINPLLQEALIENGLIEANEMQQETFSTIKSGADAVIQSGKKSGKSTTIVLNVIQRLEKQFMESPRSLKCLKNITVTRNYECMVHMIKVIWIGTKIKFL